MALWFVVLAGCGGSDGAPDAAEDEIPLQCRNIHVDRLAADWTSVEGQTANPKVRLRVVESADGYQAIYIDGSFVRRTLSGVKRDSDVKFTEVPDAARRRRVAAGQEALVRLYLKPSLKDCALKAFVGTVVDGKESIPPRATEFLPLPEQSGVVFSFDPATEPLYLGRAATDRAVRDAQLSEGPEPVAEMGAVPVGTWSAVEDDGDPSCTYDMDLYFDDLLVTEISPVAAAEPEDGERHWFHQWDAPFSGNHHFEMFRFRTCSDGQRVRIAVAGIDAVLQ